MVDGCTQPDIPDGSHPMHTVLTWTCVYIRVHTCMYIRVHTYMGDIMGLVWENSIFIPCVIPDWPTRFLWGNIWSVCTRESGHMPYCTLWPYTKILGENTFIAWWLQRLTGHSLNTSHRFLRLQEEKASRHEGWCEFMHMRLDVTPHTFRLTCTLPSRESLVGTHCPLGEAWWA